MGRLIRARFLSAVVTVGVAAVLVAACAEDTPVDEDPAEATEDTEELPAEPAGDTVAIECVDGAITVGIAKSQSGPAAFFDVAGTRGVKIAIDEINEAGGLKGCPIEIIEGDAQSDPAVAAQVARSMLNEGAQILLVPDDFDVGIAAARHGQEAGVLTLSTAASSTEFATAVGDLFFSGGITTTELGKAQARYALDQGWDSTFQVLDPGLAYFTEQDDHYRELYEAEGGEIIEVDRADSLGGQADYGSTISKIQDADPDVIQTFLIFPGVGTFVSQLRAAGVDTPVIGPLTLQTREMLDLLGDDAGGIQYAAQVYFEGAGIDADTDAEIVAFAEAYEARFDTFPEQANGPGSYQMFMAVNEALQRDDVLDARTAAEAVRAQEDLPVPGGTLARWQDGYAIWNPVIAGIEDGQFRFLDTYDATELR